MGEQDMDTPARRHASESSVAVWLRGWRRRLANNQRLRGRFRDWRRFAEGLGLGGIQTLWRRCLIRIRTSCQIDVAVEYDRCQPITR